ncbi:hypothetical protein CZ797_03585 [Pseudoalteromonas sp. JB197]|nr:hypothetical protein CZ797_03585 [Pseudoalteromonas sp. JB197]
MALNERHFFVLKSYKKLIASIYLVLFKHAVKQSHYRH